MNKNHKYDVRIKPQAKSIQTLKDSTFLEV